MMRRSIHRVFGFGLLLMLLVSGCGALRSGSRYCESTVCRLPVGVSVTQRVLFPLFAAEGDAVHTIQLPPLFRYRREGRSYCWAGPLGIFGRAENPDEGLGWVGLPLYTRNEAPKGVSGVLFPFVEWERHQLVDSGSGTGDTHPCESVLRVLGIVYRQRRRPGFTETDVLYPLFRVAKGEQEGLHIHQIQALPFFSYLMRWEPGGGGTTLKYERRFNLLWPLYSYYRDNYGPGYKRVDVLWPIFRFTSGCPASPLNRERTFYALPLLGWGRYWMCDESGRQIDRRTEFYLVDPVLSYVRSTCEGVRFRLLGPVFSYARNPSGDKDFRLFVNVVRAARSGNRRVFNLWPLVGTEWNPKTGERRTLVLLGLFYYRRSSDGSTVKRVLGIPIGRRVLPGRLEAPEGARSGASSEGGALQEPE